MKTYEVVLFENKDKTEKYVQVWEQGYEYPTYVLYYLMKFLWWRLAVSKLFYIYNYGNCLAAIERSKRRDTEKFPDLGKIKQYNEANNITPI